MWYRGMRIYWEWVLARDTMVVILHFISKCLVTKFKGGGGANTNPGETPYICVKHRESKLLGRGDTPRLTYYNIEM